LVVNPVVLERTEVSKRSEDSGVSEFKERLLLQIEGAAHWRRMKSAEWPDDERNAATATTLVTLGRKLVKIPLDDPVLCELSEIETKHLEDYDVSCVLTEQSSRYVSRYGGFDYGTENPEDFLRGLLDVYRICVEDNVRLLVEYQPEECEDDQIVAGIRIYSPSIDLILKIHSGEVDLYDVQWRDFERLVAELLNHAGWKIELQQGTKDGGVDILARKTGLPCGDVLTLWQAKRISRGRKVGISTIRELADTRNEFKASKGVIVTSSFLTRGALDRIQRDAYILGKVDRDNLTQLIRAFASK
jgi:hypothetical protein